MPRRLTTWRKWAVILALSPVGLQISPAQTNPPVAAAAPAPAPAALEDRDLFFSEFTRAAQVARQGGTTEVLGLLNLLQRKLSTSPWLDIAMLKYDQVAEAKDQTASLDGYNLLLKRVANAPFYQENERQAQIFAAALRGAAQRGIDRIRLERIRAGLQKYFARYTQYPESLAKLAILNYVDLEDIINSEGNSFHYVPTGRQFRPMMTYMQFELEPPALDPFLNPAPKVEATSRVSDNPPTYTALVRVPGRREPVRVAAGQAIEGFYFAQVAELGVIACTNDRILILLVH
jgi:hypothetical protein